MLVLIALLESLFFERREKKTNSGKIQECWESEISPVPPRFAPKGVENMNYALRPLHLHISLSVLY